MLVKRKASALTLIMALLFLTLAGMHTLEAAKANFLPAPAIQVYSPAPGTYTNKSISLSVTVNILDNSPEIVRFLFSIDGKPNATLTNFSRTSNVWFDPSKKGTQFHVESVLDNLSEGNHTLKVFSQDAEGEEMSYSVEFTIDTQYKYPIVLILSPQNTTYATTDVPLTWICDEQIVSADYWLDAPLYGSTTLQGNTTLTGLSNGTHTITVYVFTERGQANSPIIHFTVNSETQQQTEPFPIGIVAAALAVAVFAVAGLLQKTRVN
ncbi:MAG: hypothetical protein NWE94_05985 [Candidatus Bathyarchaeota archaeon]|nr:hypothetical protein [Candidatus Bathyarchaeota archaeon]